LFRYGDTSRRLTVGANGALLDERRVAFTSLTEWARRRWPFGLTAGVHTLSGMTGGVSAADVGLPGMSSTVIIPILDGKTVLGLYGVGTDLAPRFDKRAMMMLEGVWPCLSAFALSALSADGWPRRSSRSIMTKRLAGMIANGVSQDEVFKTAAAILQSELRASIVRVSTFDSDGAFLTSRALSCRNAFVANTPERGHMILSLMSVHREAGDSSVPILFDQRSESLKLSEAEATHSLNDEVGHGVLVPMIHSGRTVGVISIGRQQSSHERAIGEDDLMFAESVAELLGQTFPSRRWSDPGRSDRALQSPSTQPATDSDYGNLRTTVRTSLASILGSLEAIRLEGDTEIDRLSQHLAVIDRSARYLDDCIRQVEIDTVIGGDQGG
ncbi:MAG: hypothetical protein ACE5FH_07095, partial [Candidatus Zixiibacteriota bacterium]